MTHPKPRLLLTPGETAEMFRVDPKTVVRWATNNRFPREWKGRPVVVRTPGNHHRFDAEAIAALQTGELVWAETARKET